MSYRGAQEGWGICVPSSKEWPGVRQCMKTQCWGGRYATVVSLIEKAKSNSLVVFGTIRKTEDRVGKSPGFRGSGLGRLQGVDDFVNLLRERLMLGM